MSPLQRIRDRIDQFYARMSIREQYYCCREIPFSFLTLHHTLKPTPGLWRRLTWPRLCRAGQSISLPDSGAGSGSSLGPECPLWLRSSRPQHGSSAPSAGGHLTTSGAAGGRETQIYWYKLKRVIFSAIHQKLWKRTPIYF